MVHGGAVSIADRSLCVRFRILLYTLLRQMSRCYIAKNLAKINRQPRRLEIMLSHTKQALARQINRQLSATSARQPPTIQPLIACATDC